MKLLYKLAIRLSLVALSVILVWSLAFYFAMVSELNEEQDDALEDYAEQVIERFQNGEELALSYSGGNNQYSIQEVSASYVHSVREDRYLDHEVYFSFLGDYESARSIYCTFKGGDGKYYEVEVSVRTIEKSELLETIFLMLSILVGALFISFAVLSVFCVHSTMKPLKRLLDWINAYHPGQKNSKLQNETGISEFRQLNKAVSGMAERMESYGQQQQLFISNASHEMQTPLAISMGRLESLLEEEQLDESQASELDKVLRSLSGLSQLNKSLLMLSRIDIGQYADDRPMDLCEVIKDHNEDFQELFSAKEIRFDCNLSGPFMVEMDKVLARTLVLNLLKNAFVHTQNGGVITVHGGADSLSIRNTAEGGALQAEKIFLPFYHSAASTQSNGLGLPLAQAVARRYSLSLEYSFKDGFHIFTVSKQQTGRLNRLVWSS